MNRLRATTSSPLAPDGYLRGSFVTFARGAWIAVAVLIISLFVAGINVQVTQVQSICLTTLCETGELSAAGLRALESFGFSPGFYVVYVVTIEAAFATVYTVVAATIFWRRPNDRMALFASLTLLVFGAVTFTDAPNALTAEHSAWWLPVALLRFLGSASMGLFVYVFPDGRFVPRWARWVALVWIAWQVPQYLFPG
jgi:hypothetical protein